MQILRNLLFPFAVLYDLITRVRNIFYDKGIFKSTRFDMPIIAVGNLSVGGTGKTPMTEYLIRLLQNDYKVAVLSRGYGRKTNGFILADATATASTIGDEPFQFFKKFPKIHVAVDAKRVRGVLMLREKINPDIIILDDAYQHRAIQASFYILLTPYSDLYSNDYLLPTGNLRESRSGAQRAHIVIVTKCPKNLSQNQKKLLQERLKIQPHQKIFFSTIEYDQSVFNQDGEVALDELKQEEKVVVAGIANPKLFFAHVGKEDDHYMSFGDHHNFSSADVKRIEFTAQFRKIITTEKDYGRLYPLMPISQLYYLPIKNHLLGDDDEFAQCIREHIQKEIRN